MRSLFALLLSLFSIQLSAQELFGHVLDERKEPVVNASVCVYKDGIVMAITVTDYDGNYTVKPLEPGCYDVGVFYVNHDAAYICDVILTSGPRWMSLNFNINASKGVAKSIYTIYKKPLVKPWERTDIITYHN